MKKIKLNIILITNQQQQEYNVLGEYQKENNLIKYKESDKLLTEVKIDLKNKLLIRENKDYYLEYKFIENQLTENKIKLKELDQSLYLNIKTEKLEINDNKFEVIYTIIDSDEKVTYIIKF